MPKEEASPQEYVFRYRLGEGRRPLHHERLVELVRANLEDLLSIIRPLQGGVEVNVDGFRLLSGDEATYEIFPRTTSEKQGYSDETVPPDETPLSRKSPAFQESENTRLYEPRIDFVKRRLESLLSVVELEEKGRVVGVDGFRLKTLSDWLVPSTGEPIEVFGYLATRCNCDCVFCCLKGNPSPFPLCHPRRTAEEEYDEAKTRLKYLPSERGRALFTSLSGIYEVLAHPHCLEVLGELRKKTSKPFKITTNGESLTPDLIAGLARLQPVYLYVSLISSSPQRRKKLMRSQNPQIAIDALPLLREKGVPYAVVVVPWPLDSMDEMLDDLSTTAAYAEEHEAHMVEVNLPGYSRFFPGEELFNLDEVWSATVSRVRELREKVTCPIVAMPAMYEENLYEERKNLPRVVGTVRNSPAAYAGLERGDLILEINGLSVRNRPQARDILSLLQSGENEQARLAIRRADRTLQLTVDLEKYTYPYSRDIDNHLGIVFLGTGLRLSYLENLKELIDSHRARHVLFLSSALVRPTFEQSLAESRLFNDPRLQIDISVPRNNFFGGNIFMGDLLVVQDFIDHIKEYVETTGKRPDLVVIPSSPFNLGQWRRDLTGRVYLDIERETGVPVELLECATIYE